MHGECAGMQGMGGSDLRSWLGGSCVRSRFCYACVDIVFLSLLVVYRLPLIGTIVGFTVEPGPSTTLLLGRVSVCCMKDSKRREQSGPPDNTKNLHARMCGGTFVSAWREMGKG